MQTVHYHLMSSSTYALITGASKGIGKSIANSLAKRKINVLLVARSQEALIQLAHELQTQYGIQAAYLAIDLAETGAAQKVKNWCYQNAYSVHILVNNAGYGTWGRFDALTLKAQSEMLQLNMLTLVEMSYLLLPELKLHNQSYLLNVASTAAFQAMPSFSLYAASKSFVLSFSRGLRYELKDSRISVTCLCPGPVNTGFVDRAGLSFMKAKAEKFGMMPDEVAETAIKAMFQKKSQIIPGFLNKISVFIIPFLPKKWVEQIAANIYN